MNVQNKNLKGSALFIWMTDMLVKKCYEVLLGLFYLNSLEQKQL